MKIKFLCSLWLLAATVSAAAPLTQTTAVHTKPDRASPAITYLKAGTEPVAATAAMPTTPAGWMAVELPGPFEVYVENKDLTKALDVRPGAPMRVAPKADAGVLAIAEKGDKTSITGLRGRWTQLSLEKKLTGYINVGNAPGYMPPIATAPAGASTPVVPSPSGPAAVTPAPIPAEPVSPAPVTPAAYGLSTRGEPAPMVNLGDGGPSSLPRQFAGRLVSTRRPMTPRRPYDWALNDDAGKRYAYVDVSKLLDADQIEKYGNRQVFIFGTARSTTDGKDLVIAAETLQLR